MDTSWKTQNNWSDNGRTNMSPGKVNTDAASPLLNRGETIARSAKSRPDSKEAAEAEYDRHMGGPLPTPRATQERGAL